MKQIKTHTLCTECPLRKTNAFKTNSPEEMGYIHAYKHKEWQFDQGETLISELGDSAYLYTILSGWAFRYQSLSDGRRQILNFLLPGDFVGLQSHLAQNSFHGVEALTDVQVCVFAKDGVMDLYRAYPSIGFDLTWLCAHEEHLVDGNLLTVGQRHAKERIAMLLIHLYKRAERLDLVESNAMAFPVTQQHIADALGLSLVHTNKTIRFLENMDLFSIKQKRLTMKKPNALLSIADFYQAPIPQRPLI